ncbi:PAAR-like protein [Flavobacterium tructae]|uniref:PAAR-like protein n=1 Tax=Flavobacterium tructae TaxID=1114873 RepID=UPI0035A85C09
MAKYICNGAQCICTMGTKEGMLEVKSQTKIFIQDKLMATENEKSFSLNFKLCNKSSPPTPCQPTIETPWTSTKSNVFQSDHKGLLETSTATCTFGKGEISIIDSKQAQTKNVIFGDYSSEPKEISKVYAKVRTLASYNGEFGFDWVDVDPETMEIQKIQGVPFEKVEYFYKKGNTAQDLGNIIPIGEDKPAAIQAIQRNYDLIDFCDYVDTPFILIKPGEPVTLSLEVFFEGESQDDYISITGDDFYSFKIDGEEERKDENDKTTKKKIVAKEQLQLTINCSKESLDKKYFFLHTGAKGPREIGGLNMMKNKELKLKFRVIALVSNEGNPNEKAKALFKKFKNAGIKEYLNNNSLNQAGYEVEIENFDAMDQVDVNDYIYAFDKEDWKNKKYFTVNPKRTKNVLGKDENGNDIWIEEIMEGQLGDWLAEDGVDENGNVKYKNIKKNNLDYETIDAYKKQLKKEKSWNEGFIILSDYECSNQNIGAYSNSSPLNHYALFVYSINVESKDTYAHEIGHMLGLSHLFYHQDEKDNYKNTRETILGNGEPEKNQDGTNNPKYKQGLKDQIEKVKSEKYGYYDITVSYSFKDSLIKYINNFISSYKQKLLVVNYTETAKIDIKKSIKVSEDALITLKSIEDYSYKLYNLKCSFLKDDYIAYLIQIKNYYLEILNQTENSILFYKQESTNNIMDYSKIKLFYNHNQIQIMRNDFKNYSQEKV